MGKFNYQYFKKVVGVFSFSILSMAGNAFGSDEGGQLFEIARGNSYLALTSAEIVGAHNRHGEQEANENLRQIANHRADLLCGARGFREVGAPPVLKDAAPQSALGPWKNNFANLVRSAELNLAFGELDLELKQTKFEALARHKVFSSLQCRVPLHQ